MITGLAGNRGTPYRQLSHFITFWGMVMANLHLISPASTLSNITMSTGSIEYRLERKLGESCTAMTEHGWDLGPTVSDACPCQRAMAGVETLHAGVTLLQKSFWVEWDLGDIDPVSLPSALWTALDLP